MTMDLFAILPGEEPWQEALASGARLLHRFARSEEEGLLSGIAATVQLAPFRQMTTPGRFIMSVAMTSCGRYGWTSDADGYRYRETDPLTGRPWPAMPPGFSELAGRAAECAGFPGFRPNACLINRYRIGAKMSLHQDKDERDLRQPIVSVSLGLQAVFLFGGAMRGDRAQRFLLEHGDVVVWGGPSRLRYHGILALKAGRHPLVGEYRFNLTFRVAD